ncbi:hypothetical protein J1N35_000465 [Gossypium stocksii]|uniref:Uncharacterized protein n=1 Tax=Gossypium stocksii TaxID=47602 RepID=A0A9D3WFS7_9ROSI|nr:hypothetical protein J1N35_000465 [Gossypium stocksii]
MEEHYSRDSLKNKKGARKIIQLIQQSGIKIRKDDDIESIGSIEDEPSERTICAKPAYPDKTSNSESEYSNVYMLQAQAQKDCDNRIPVLHILVKIYLNKYSKPIIIIAFIDTRVAEIIMNPNVLPTDW